MTLITTILFGYIVALAAPLGVRLFRSKAGFVLAIYPFIIFLELIIQIIAAKPFEPELLRMAWVPTFDLWLSFRLDGLSYLMAAIISGIGTLVIWYGSFYLKDHPHLSRFYSLILFFMTSMLGLVMSDNALLLFIFWELTSISSFFLIGFDHHDSAARAAAWQALLVTGGGGLILLASLVMLSVITGSFEISVWMAAAAQIQLHPLAPAAFILLAIGAMTKSAQFPFHFWLPNAMKAPTPVSAYLHSATMVKAGIFLLLRFHPVLGGLEIWDELLVPIGLLTLLAGSLLALGQTDLKRILAYSTVAALGSPVLLIGVGTPLAIKAALVVLAAHAMYKGALFLVAGGIDHATGTRDVRLLGGLAHRLPFTAAAAAIAGLSMAGIPPLAGFVAKELFYETTLAAPASPLITSLVLAANAATIFLAAWVTWSPFWGKASQNLHPHPEPISLWLPPLLLAIAGLAFGLWIQTAGAILITPAVSAVLQTSYPVKLSLWHGFSPMLGLSALTILLGVIGFTQRVRIQVVAERLFHGLEPFGPANLYNRSLKAVLAFANLQTRLLQNGYLRIYILVILLTTFILTITTLLFRLEAIPFGKWSTPRFYDVMLLAVIVSAAILVTRSTSRLTTIALLGSIGFSIAILFLLYSAPDLAMVQFSIETLIVILFVLAMYRLPKFSRLSSKSTKIFDMVIAAIGGGLMTLLMLIVSFHPTDSRLASFFMENSLLAAKGRNVVNVILVDFRGFDTLGEISVLAIAAVGVFALIRFTRKPAIKSSKQKRITIMQRSILLPVATRYLMPLLLVFSIFLLIRGHNEVGGGFVCGLVASSALMLDGIAISPEALRKLLPISAERLVSPGLCGALLSGVIPVFAGKPFMTGLWLETELPVLGKVGTPLLFDLGVYLLVIGIVIWILLTFAEE